MIKKIFSKIIYLPFLFPLIYQIKIPLKELGSINLLDLVLLTSIILGAVLIFQEKKWEDFKKYLFKDKFLKPLFLFILFGLFSLFIKNKLNDFNNLGLLKSYFILPIFFGIIINYFLKRKDYTWQSFFYCYFYYSLFLGFLTIIFKLIQITTFDNRVHLFFDSPNQLGIALSLGLISGLILWRQQKNNSFYLIPFFVLFIALFFTKSTGAIVAILLTIPFIYKKKPILKPRLFLRFIVFLSIFLVSIFFFLTPILNKANHNPFLNKTSFDSRLAIYLSTQKIISDNFLNGVGLVDFQKHYLKNQTEFPPYPQWAVPHSHNLFTQIWLSFGFTSFLIWFYLLFKKTLSNKSVFKKISIYFLLYFLIHGLIDVPIWNNDQAFFFWFIFLL